MAGDPIPLPILAPISGTLVPLDQVPDPVFSQRMLGDGLAIDPAAGAVVAPAAGQIAALYPTGHALGLRTPGGCEILIHLGIDTARLEGVFRPRVQQGETVRAGQPLIDVDLERLRALARSPLVPVIVTRLPAGRPVTLPLAPGTPVRGGVDAILVVGPGREDA
ncbi:MAG: PTS glucose transporter subunit IIA [Firmicutes bacterium]|nr:PTS glucose transporter subunit IIA [Bacillota bacterium]